MCLCSRIYHDEAVEPGTINDLLRLIRKRALHDTTLGSGLGFTINEKHQECDSANELASRELCKEGEDRGGNSDGCDGRLDSECREGENPALEQQQGEVREVEEQAVVVEENEKEVVVVEENEEEEESRESGRREKEDDNPNSSTEKEQDPALCSDSAVRKWMLPQAIIDTLRVNSDRWLENASSFWNDNANGKSSFSEPLTDVFFALKTISEQNIINNLKGVILTILLYRLRQECPFLDPKIIPEQIQQAGYYSHLSNKQLEKDYEKFYIIGRRHSVLAQSLNGIGAIPLLYDDNVPRSRWEGKLRLTGKPFNEAMTFLKRKGILIGQQYNGLLEHLLHYRKQAIWLQWQQANVGAYQEPPQSYFVPVIGTKRRNEDRPSLQVAQKRPKMIDQAHPKPTSAVLPQAGQNSENQQQRVFRVCHADAQAKTLSSASAGSVSVTLEQTLDINQSMAVSEDQGHRCADLHDTRTAETVDNREIMVSENIPGQADQLEICGLGTNGSCAPVLNHNLDHFGNFAIPHVLGGFATSAFDGHEADIFASVVPVLNHGLEPFSDVDTISPMLNSGLDDFDFMSTSPVLNRGLDCFNNINDSEASLQQHLSLIFPGVESGNEFVRSQELHTPVPTSYATHTQDLYTEAAMISEGQEGNGIPQARTDNSALLTPQPAAQLCW